METYIATFPLMPFTTFKEFPRLAEQVTEKIKAECPGIRWKESYVTLGPVGAVDIVEAQSREGVERAALIIRAFGHATTQTLPATPWKTFLTGKVLQ